RLVFLDPDVFGLARHVAEAGIPDQEPLGLGRLDRDRRIAGVGDTEDLLRRRAAERRDGDDEEQREASHSHRAGHTIAGSPGQHISLRYISLRWPVPTESVAPPPR